MQLAHSPWPYLFLAVIALMLFARPDSLMPAARSYIPAPPEPLLWFGILADLGTCIYFYA